jgi:hypothetical protein
VGFIFDYIFMGKPRSIGGTNAQKLVEYGVARFVGNSADAVVDEPLALLAVTRYYNAESTWNLRHFLSEATYTLNDSARSFAFEHFIVHLLGLSFKSPTRLSDVFHFIVPNSIQDEKATLVALGRMMAPPQSPPPTLLLRLNDLLLELLLKR